MRITDLNTLVTASLNDILYIVDVSDTGDFISGSSKQITVGNFFSSSNVGGGGGGGGGGGSGYLVLTSSVVSASVNIDSTVFISNGIQTAYNVSGSATESADDLIVFINGVSQIPNVNYTLSSSILTFSGTPSSGSKIDVRRANSVLSVTFITSSMGVEYFAGNNSSSQFTLTNGQTVLHNYDVLVSIDGLIQKPTTDYSISSSIISFAVPPPNNTDVEIRYLSPQTFTFISGSGGGSGTTLTTGSTYPITSSWSNNALTASYLDPISQSLIPWTGSTYSLGSPINKWKDLYVSTGSIYIGDVILSTSGSVVLANSAPLVAVNTASGLLIVPGLTASLSSSYALTALSSSYAVTASYVMNGGGGSGTGFPFSGSAVITGSLNVSQTITLNNTVVSASGNTLYLNGSPISVLQFAYFSASISSSTEVGILNVRNTLLQGRSLLNGNIYISNLSSGSNMTMNIYNSNTNALFQTETILPTQNLILNLTDFIPLKISGSGYFLFQITSSVV
jgi:hypothetical protein